MLRRIQPATAEKESILTHFSSSVTKYAGNEYKEYQAEYKQQNMHLSTSSSAVYYASVGFAPSTLTAEQTKIWDEKIFPLHIKHHQLSALYNEFKQDIELGDFARQICQNKISQYDKTRFEKHGTLKQKQIIETDNALKSIFRELQREIDKIKAGDQKDLTRQLQSVLGKLEDDISLTDVALPIGLPEKNSALLTKATLTLQKAAFEAHQDPFRKVAQEAKAKSLSEIKLELTDSRSQAAFHFTWLPYICFYKKENHVSTLIAAYACGTSGSLMATSLCPPNKQLLTFRNDPNFKEELLLKLCADVLVKRDSPSKAKYASYKLPHYLLAIPKILSTPTEKMSSDYLVEAETEYHARMSTYRFDERSGDYIAHETQSPLLQNTFLKNKESDLKGESLSYEGESLDLRSEQVLGYNPSKK